MEQELQALRDENAILKARVAELSNDPRIKLTSDLLFAADEAFHAHARDYPGNAAYREKLIGYGREMLRAAGFAWDDDGA